MILKLLIFCLPSFLIAETVVTVHGFMNSNISMKLIGKQLPNDWQILNWEYPSRNKTIFEHGQDLVIELQKIRKKNEPIHFVGHSMGCLVIRSALNHPNCPTEAKIGKAVFLGPPNRGSLWAQKLQKLALFRWIMGPYSGKELALPLYIESLGDIPLAMDVLIIAGTLSFNPFLPKENDGMVMVEETALPTPFKLIILKETHGSMLLSEEVFLITRSFLQNIEPIPRPIRFSEF